MKAGGFQDDWKPVVSAEAGGVPPRRLIPPSRPIGSGVKYPPNSGSLIPVPIIMQPRLAVIVLAREAQVISDGFQGNIGLAEG